MKIFKLHFFTCQEINKKYLETSNDWMSYEKQTKVPLKTTKFPLFCIWTTLFGLSFIPSSRFIPDHIPTVVSKDRWIHIPWYLFFIAAIPWSNRSPCSPPNSPQFNGMKSTWECKNCILVTYFSQGLCRTSGGLPPATYNYLLCNFQETLLLLTEKLRMPSFPCNRWSKVSSLRSSRICGPTKTPSLIFASLNLGDLSQRHFKPAFVLNSYKVFH